MGRRSSFSAEDFLRAARSLAAERGAAAVTVATVAARLKAPTGSFYHRFDGRDALLAELWLATVSDFQRGFIALADLGDGERAALHTVDWSRGNPEAAAILLLRHPADFLPPEAPAAAREAARAQSRQIEACRLAIARLRRAIAASMSGRAAGSPSDASDGAKKRLASPASATPRLSNSWAVTGWMPACSASAEARGGSAG